MNTKKEIALITIIGILLLLILTFKKEKHNMK